MRKIILFFVLLFSRTVFADTYPVHLEFGYGGTVYPSGQAACDVAMPPVPSQGKTTKFVPPTTCQQIVNDAVYTTAYISIYMTCPGGGTVSWGGSYEATTCINADPCTSPKVRDSVTGECKAPLPVTCQTTPTTTTSGSTQTLFWETLNTGSNSCDPHSLNCDYPLVGNPTTKQCDLSCSDGSTVDVSAGAQCPPPSCLNQVQGNMIIKQSWNTVTLKCANSDIVYCDGQLETPDAVSGDCLPKPGVIDCGNGIVVISPVKCPSEPDHSQDITCLDGIIISPPRVCALLPPDPERDCPGHASDVESTGYVNGVPTCIMKDGTTTAAADGSQSPPDDKYNPQDYKAGVACNASNSYPCDPSLPVVNALGVTGIEVCGPKTFFQCADKHDKPVIPDLHPASPSPTTATTITTGTNTTIITNSDGSTSTQISTTNNTGTTKTTGGSTPGLATEDTVREIASRLGKSSRSVSVWRPGNGTGPPSDTNAEEILSKKAAVSSMISDIKSQMSGLMPSVSSGASISCDGGVYVMGITFNICLAPYTEQLSKIGIGVYVAAIVLSVMIIFG